ncbi:MAG: HEAT repeat domain-containing protein [Candidatus Odinarchaeota archaeon]
MSKELKDIIDSIDSTNRAHSDLERMIKYLREEVIRLTFTINEQKQIIQNQRAQISDIESNGLPGDVQILKEMVGNQREEIVKKDKDIEILKQTIEDISNELENSKSYSGENEEIIYSNKVIVQLTEENELKNEKIKELQEKIENMQQKSLFTQQIDFEDKDQQLIDAKKLIFQLTEENGINRVKIESLKAEIQEITSKLEDSITAKNKISEELNDLRKERENIIIESNEYKEKVNYLQQKMENTIKSYLEEQKVDSDVKIEEISGRFHELESENKNLKNALNENVFITDELRNHNNELENKLNDIRNLEIKREAEYRKKIALKEEELEILNVKFNKLENANNQLNNLLLKLKKQEKGLLTKSEQRIPAENNDSRSISPSLFIKMFDLLEEQAQNQILELLLKNLNDNMRMRRITAIKLLSMIRTPKIFNAFKEMVRDNDWIIKMYLIKALARFNNSEVKEVLQELYKDPDVDVREAAEKALREFGF